MSGIWQTINTAPKDGTTILGKVPLVEGEQTEALRWDALQEGWVRPDRGSAAITLFPQEWKPLPEVMLTPSPLLANVRSGSGM
jgi:hypothetical protein